MDEGLHIICTALSYGEDTYAICRQAFLDIITRGYHRIVTSLEDKWSKIPLKRGILVRIKLPWCQGSYARWRRSPALAGVDPSNPAESPGFILPPLVAQLKSRPTLYCVPERLYAEPEPVPAWQHSHAAEILCRVFNAGSRGGGRALHACISAIRLLAEHGYAMVKPTDATSYRALERLRVYGVLQKARLPDCNNTAVYRTVYMVDHKRFNKVADVLMRLSTMPPGCINP